MTQDTREAMELLLANRLYLYSLFHKLIGREPDGELLALLSAENTAESLRLLSAGEDDALAKAADFLASVRLRLDDSDFLESVKSEYMRLFVGPATLVAPPWESVYRGEDAVLFQEVTLEVRETYRGYGLLPEGYPHVADDSLALELAFLAKLAERAVEDLQNGDETGLGRLLEGSEEFLTRHLLAWFPAFLQRLGKSPTRVLYPQLCRILGRFLERDRDTLRELRAAL